jgi:hypothetical protein
MRRSFFVGCLSSALMACGIFGASDDPAKTDEPIPPPGTPQDNAQPPPAVGSAAPEGVFVSSSLGANDGTGTSLRPVKTLKQAFELARDRKLRVIACAEVYEENLDLIDGVSAYGYYDCKKTPWERGAPRAILKAPHTPAVLAKGIKLPTRIEGFEMRSPDLDGAPATDTSGTSIGLEVRETTSLTISESLIHGGKGAPGTDGTDGPDNKRTTASDGVAAYDQTGRTCPQPLYSVAYCTSYRTVPGPPGGVTTCAVGPNGGPGGQGGDSRWYAYGSESMGAYVYRGRPLAATAATALGGDNDDASGMGHGLSGARGANGAEGTDGANGAWALTAAGFVRGNGVQGGAGAPGQGGGGGAGSRAWFAPQGGLVSPPQNEYSATASGGSGAGGGCGGQAGTPGTGGGASIGTLVIGSTVTFAKTRIESSDGGRAGKGNLGKTGISGGTGGAGTVHTILTTGNGGDGGAGGNGGASGHGAPGPSVALAFSGTRPTTTETELAPGPAGAGQPQLKRTVGGTIGDKLLPAVVGVSEAEHQIQ